jgi:hypothetical protein
LEKELNGVFFKFFRLLKIENTESRNWPGSRKIHGTVDGVFFKFFRLLKIENTGEQELAQAREKSMGQ